MNTLLSSKNTEERQVWVDYMRVIACFMVMIVHSTEPFYLGGDGSLILTEADSIWVSFFDSAVRMCVPLFIIASSYLQFPLKYPTSVFFKKRIVRILIPFAVWTLVYVFYWGEPVTNLSNLVLNFNYSAGHLWFVYMLIGVYLLMPLLSPWAEKVSKRELQVYLGIWLFTTLIPLIRDWVYPGQVILSEGPSGLMRQAPQPFWGEASWNAYGTFYYMSGFIGYLLLGLYFRKFVTEKSWFKTLIIAIPSYLVGFGFVFGGFLRRVFITADGVFPVAGGIEKAIWWETTWCNDTFGVALMTIASVMIFSKIKLFGVFYNKIVLPISKASYGMYLGHLIVVVWLSTIFRNSLSLASDGVLGIWTTPIQIMCTALSSFIIVSICAIILQKIPKIGKYIIG